MAIEEPVPNFIDSRSYPDIGDYAVIGDCRTAALVSKYGCIDWLCWPRFDSPSIFAALLDRERGGYWKIAPAGPFSIQREYLQGSNVLQTSFQTSSGAVALLDLMPVRDTTQAVMVPDHEIIREVSCTAGQVEIEIELVPRANYGEKVPRFAISVSWARESTMDMACTGYTAPFHCRSKIRRFGRRPPWLPERPWLFLSPTRKTHRRCCLRSNKSPARRRLRQMVAGLDCASPVRR